MMTVKRYTQQFEDYGVVEKSTGEYVRFRDYESLHQQLAAAQQEIAGLNDSNKFMDGLVKEWVRMKAAASQLREKQLRKALELLHEHAMIYIPQYGVSWNVYESSYAALALPTDDTALREYVQEKCVKGLNYMADKWLGSPTKETYEAALNEALKGE